MGAGPVPMGQSLYPWRRSLAPTGQGLLPMGWGPVPMVGGAGAYGAEPGAQGPAAHSYPWDRVHCLWGPSLVPVGQSLVPTGQGLLPLALVCSLPHISGIPVFRARLGQTGLLPSPLDAQRPVRL